MLLSNDLAERALELAHVEIKKLLGTNEHLERLKKLICRSIAKLKAKGSYAFVLDSPDFNALCAVFRELAKECSHLTVVGDKVRATIRYEEEESK